MRIDHASASARSASRTASLARWRAPSARIFGAADTAAENDLARFGAPAKWPARQKEARTESGLHREPKTSDHVLIHHVLTRREPYAAGIVGVAKTRVLPSFREWTETHVRDLFESHAGRNRVRRGKDAGRSKITNGTSFFAVCRWPLCVDSAGQRFGRRARRGPRWAGQHQCRRAFACAARIGRHRPIGISPS